MKNILITGGAGFIGSHAVNYFLEKYSDYNIINLDKLSYAASKENMSLFANNDRHTFIKGNICDASLVERVFIEYDIKGVIHFAAESHVDNSIHQPDIFIKTNVFGTFTLLEAARKYWKNQDQHRFHHISTDEVYGTLSNEGYFTETTAYAPNSPYSASKASADHLVRSYYRTYGLNAVITNCSNNYGPHQHQEKLIPTIIRNALKNLPIPIYGNGKNIRDWLYVKDHCRAIDLVFHCAKPGEQYNIGGNHELSNIELALMLCKELNVLVPPKACKDYCSLIQFVTDRPGHDFRYAINSEKITQQLNWRPETDFIIGLKQTINYYSSFHQLENLRDFK